MRSAHPLVPPKKLCCAAIHKYLNINSISDWPFSLLCKRLSLAQSINLENGGLTYAKPVDHYATFQDSHHYAGLNLQGGPLRSPCSQVGAWPWANNSVLKIFEWR
jgi:hypothetical protein